MKRVVYGLIGLGTLIGTVGCGDADGAGGTSSGGTNSGGTPATGGGSDGGAATGGSTPGAGGGDGTGGATPEGAHCSPGTLIPWVDAYLGHLQNCGSNRSISMGGPVGPGDVFAFSADMGSRETDSEMQLWGTTEHCGEPQELLAVDKMGPGIRCLEVRPQEGTYTHLIWVWEAASAGHADVTLCMDGLCAE